MPIVLKIGPPHLAQISVRGIFAYGIHKLFLGYQVAAHPFPLDLPVFYQQIPIPFNDPLKPITHVATPGYQVVEGKNKQSHAQNGQKGRLPGYATGQNRAKRKVENLIKGGINRHKLALKPHHYYAKHIDNQNPPDQVLHG